MIKAGAIEKGSCLLIKGDPYLVTEREFVNPGKGAAFARVKLKNLKTGQVLRETIKTSESVEVADVFDRTVQYLYQDDEAVHVMDTDTYEQFELSPVGLEDKLKYIKEGETYNLVVWNELPIDIKIPTKVVYTVTEAAEGVKGDTVNGATKMVTIETGVEVRVPIFIKQGERIMVNTETNEYVERVNS
ncbi:MAG: elongation factor P [Spirochaetaceae bacterium]|nr:MAG: elongation factor P [Spirochaetaceae bacterium]